MNKKMTAGWMTRCLALLLLCSASLPAQSASAKGKRARRVGVKGKGQGQGTTVGLGKGKRGSAPQVALSSGPVLVTIVVDQLAAWVLDERIALLAPAPAGGFARLSAEGTRVRAILYGHSATNTAPGHAALYTGAPPHASGIVGNEVPPIAACASAPAAVPFFERDSILLDPETKQVPASATAAKTHCGSSLRALLVPTLADELRATDPGAVIVSLSLKDRGALFGAGRKPNAALWFDSSAGQFITSTAFADALPAWIGAENDAVKKMITAGIEWKASDGVWLAAHAGTIDDQEGEGDDYGASGAYPGMGRHFPHLIKSGSAFRTTPFADEALFAGALAAMDALGPTRGPHALLVALSLSSNDAVGHVFGPDSWEAWDELHRLDAALGHFLSDLDMRFGRNGYAVMLSADHGVIHMVEACGAAVVDRWARPCKADALRLMQDVAPEPRVTSKHNVEQVSLLIAAADRAGAAGKPWILGITEPYIHLTDAGREGKKRLLDELAAHPLPGVRRIVDMATMPAACPPLEDDTDNALLCRGTLAGHGGDLYFIVEPGSYSDPRYSRGHGSSHGSPYLYDRTVPLFVRAPGRVKAGVLVEEMLPYTAFVRTAATLLSVAPPRGALPGPDLTKR